jgi:DNA helicase-2/ATP-dependent DNA helicase PcrA
MDFDIVVVVGADETAYGTSELDAKLLYVAVTRALHRLYLLWTGRPSPLLG